MGKRLYTCTVIADIEAASAEEAARTLYNQVRSSEACMVSVRDYQGNSDDIEITPTDAAFTITVNDENHVVELDKENEFYCRTCGADNSSEGYERDVHGAQKWHRELS
jgi:hypothetical protein